jgi:hypothetical protein
VELHIMLSASRFKLSPFVFLLVTLSCGNGWTPEVKAKHQNQRHQQEIKEGVAIFNESSRIAPPFDGTFQLEINETFPPLRSSLFGQSIDIDGDVLVVGAQNFIVNDIYSTGVAYVYSKDETSQQQQQWKLEATFLQERV